MKILTKKKNVQKIMIGLVIVLLFNFIVPNYSKAADENIIDWVIRPISFLFTTLFDGMNYLMPVSYTHLVEKKKKTQKNCIRKLFKMPNYRHFFID